MTMLPPTNTAQQIPQRAGGTLGTYGMGAESPLVQTVGGGPGMPGGPGMGGLSGADVWRVIRANIWLIILSVVVSTGLGVGLNMVLQRVHPRFRSSGTIAIQPTRQFTFKSDEVGNDTVNPVNVALEQRTQAQLLRQDSLFTEALRTSDQIRATSWFAQFANPEDAKLALEDDFSATPIPDTRLVSLSMSCALARDARVIVREIGDLHIRQQAEFNKAKQADRGMMLQRARNTYDVRLKAVQQELREKAIQLSIDGLGTPGRLSARELELADQVRMRSEAQAKLSEASAALAGTEAAVRQGQDPSAVTEVLMRDPALLSYQQQIDSIDAQIAALELKLSPDHPLLQALRVQRGVMLQKMEDRKAELRAQVRVMVLDRMRSDAAQAQQNLDTISQRMADTQREIADMTSAMSTYLLRKDEEKELLDNIKQIDQQLDLLAQFQNNPDLAGLNWAAYPNLPTQLSFPRMSITIAGTVLLGLALCLGVVFLREVTDTRVRSPRDIAKVGPITVLGLIPHEDDDPQAAGARLPLVIFDSPQSALAEQFRQLRSRLYHSASLDTVRSMLVTSPSPDDGKSTVACNLAAGLALNGRRILLVDANFRRPQVHRVFNIGNETGFSTALASTSDFGAGVRETQIPNLSVMTTGPRPANASELLESQLLLDFMHRALEEYDHVIFDSGPLLFVSESMALAPRVDGVISVIRARTSTRGLLQRLRDVLRQVKATHLGVVLNAVHTQAGGYYGRNIKTHYAYQNGQ